MRTIATILASTIFTTMFQLGVMWYFSDRIEAFAMEKAKQVVLGGPTKRFEIPGFNR